MIKKYKEIKSYVKVWNLWRKLDGHGLIFKLQVLFGKKHSPYFESLLNIKRRFIF